MKTKLTDEQFYELCCRYEKLMKSHTHRKDRIVDWNEQSYIWDKWNPRNFK